MQLVKDFWRCGIVAADATSIVRAGSLDGLAITWLPGTSGLRYRADPFGIWRDGQLYVFAESFDYAEGVGRIDVTTLDAALTVLDHRTVLSEPWHLSYPYVFEAEGETWMLPEASESCGLHLYRATHFPVRWERAIEIRLDHIPLDATLLREDDLWWLFYAPLDPPAGRLSTLCAAYASTLAGPWTAHVDSPVFTDRRGARPGGTPIVIDGVVHLPLQRCTGSYGTGLRLLRLDRLSRDRIAGSIVGEIDPPQIASPYDAGCHTLSAAGPVTLIDVKQMRFSPLALAAWPLRGFRHRRRLRQFA